MNSDDEKVELLREFVSIGPQGLLMLDGDLRNVQASPRWVEDWGEESVQPGVHHYEACPFVLPHWKEAHQAALTTRAVTHGIDRFLVEGQEHWTSWQVLPWGETKGSLGIIICAEDITERLRTRQTLRECRNDLQALLTQYCESVCTCDEDAPLHGPTCWASPTTPLIVRAEQALRKLSQLEDRFKIDTQNP